jgi:branched-chain amino acid transport system permease protein
MPLNHEAAYWVQQALNAITLASFYVPLALAYSLVQGLTNKIFLSFGDFAMYASFAAIYSALIALQADINPYAILFLSLAVGMACAAALGHVAATQIFAPLKNRSAQAFMIGSIGVSIALQEGMRLQSENRDVWLPPLLEDAPIQLITGSFPVNIGMMQMIAILVSIAVVCLVLVVLKYSKLGLYWQACSQSEILAKLTGVDTDKVLRWTLVFSAILGSVSGWIIVTTSGGINFAIGIMLGFKALFASVIGGFGTIAGAIKGGLFLAVAETLWTSIFPTDYRDVAVFAVIIIILMYQPDGLNSSFSRRESEA